MSTRRIRSNRRGNKGSCSSVLYLVSLQAIFASAALSMDVAHQNSVRTDLQSATDAAAMAGEQILLASTPENDAGAIAAAKYICSQNLADGTSVSQNSNTTVTVVVTPAGSGSTVPTIKVTASRNLHNIFGMLIGHGSDTIAAVSAAGAGEAKVASAIFPMTVIDRNYQPNSTYTWYISDMPGGLAPGLVTAISGGLTGLSTGSSNPPTYPGTMLGDNTARFLTPFNGNATAGILAPVEGLTNGLGGGLGLGQPGTVLGGVLSSTIGTTGTATQALISGSNSPLSAPDQAALSMLDYWSTTVSTSPVSANFQLAGLTVPATNGGTFPTLPSSPIAPPAVAVGQQVLVTTGANSASNNALDTTAQYLQGPSGNLPPGATSPSYTNSNAVTGAGLPSSTSPVLQGSVASWLQGQVVTVATTTPSPVNSDLTLPILDINLLGQTNATTATYTSSSTGLLGSVVEPLTGVSTATPTAAVINRFINVKISSVTVEYQGVNGVNILGLGLLSNPWAQQVIRITGTVLPASATAGYGGSSHEGTGSGEGYAAMLIQ